MILAPTKTSIRNEMVGLDWRRCILYRVAVMLFGFRLYSNNHNLNHYTFSRFIMGVAMFPGVLDAMFYGFQKHRSMLTLYVHLYRLSPSGCSLTSVLSLC